ncbi:MAG TPA: ATP-binding protein [Terracidiphilus sp.]|jgi:signal transduction histidine kinase|nr:ATP-binding protein [Terracidiphilus sp.]
MLSPTTASTLAAPPVPTPIEEVAAALERIGPLHGLPLEDRLWLARNGEEVVGEPGQVLFEEGQPADKMILILKGEIHVRRQRGGPMELFIGRSGQMTGLLPFSRMKVSGGQGFAVSPVWALLIPKDRFPEMLQAIPSMAQRVVSTLLDRVREVTRIEQQAEKLGALGKLAGNLAHELNNPASAAQRAASSLVNELRGNRQNRFKLVNLCLSEEQIRGIEEWEQKVLSRNPALEDRDAGDLIAREEQLRTWLTELPCDGAWDVAAQLNEQGATLEDLIEFRKLLEPREACVALQYFARYLRSTRSVETLLNSTDRIFDLISAVKAYSYMDRAPILEVDVPAGLDATLQMFHSRMTNVAVERDYQADLPHISAYGSELNQVWTALIENALEALGNAGTLRLGCRLEGEMLLVEIWDTGPGIPPDLQDRIFEPFFTTKAPGQGLGLGLDNAMRIVRKHRGHISVRSEPGSTCFRVRLPLDQLQAY